MSIDTGKSNGSLWYRRSFGVSFHDKRALKEFTRFVFLRVNFNTLFYHSFNQHYYVGNLVDLTKFGQNPIACKRLPQFYLDWIVNNITSLPENDKESNFCLLNLTFEVIGKYVFVNVSNNFILTYYRLLLSNFISLVYYTFVFLFYKLQVTTFRLHQLQLS